MKKIIAFVFVIIGIGLIIYSLFFNKPQNNFSGFIKEGGEYRKTYSIKSENVESKMKVTFPALEEEGFSCNGGSEYHGNCSSKNISFSADVTTIRNYKEEAKIYFDNDKKNSNNKTVEEVKCLENAFCYKVISSNGTERLYIFMQGGSEKEIFIIDYSFHNGKVEDYLDDLLENIVTSYDATYTIGKKDGDNLLLHFKTDTNETESFAYVDLKLDGNKYQEVEVSKNTTNRTVVKTDNSDYIYLSFCANSTNDDDGYEYYSFLTSSGEPFIIHFIPEDNRERPNLTKLNINDKTVFFNPSYNCYAIDAGKNVMLNVEFTNPNDAHLISDFSNISGEYVGYTR